MEAMAENNSQSLIEVHLSLTNYAFMLFCGEDDAEHRLSHALTRHERAKDSAAAPG